MTPLVTADGSVVRVNRGWIAAGADARTSPDVPAPPSGTVTVVGRVRLSEPAPPRPRTCRPGRSTDLDVRRITVAGPVYPGYLELVTSDPPETGSPAVTSIPAAGARRRPAPVVRGPVDRLRRDRHRWVLRHRAGRGACGWPPRTPRRPVPSRRTSRSTRPARRGASAGCPAAPCQEEPHGPGAHGSCLCRHRRLTRSRPRHRCRKLVADGAKVVLAARDDATLAEASASRAAATTRSACGPTWWTPRPAERLGGGGDGALRPARRRAAERRRAAAGDGHRDDRRRVARGFESVFLGPLRVARACASSMVADPADPAGAGPAIAFVLSSSARAPIPGLAVSNGLRAGLARVAKDLADELGPRGIRVNGLLPGRVATDRVHELDAKMGAPDAVRRRQRGVDPARPLRRAGRVRAGRRVPAVPGGVLPRPASRSRVDGGAARACDRDPWRGSRGCSPCRRAAQSAVGPPRPRPASWLANWVR